MNELPILENITDMPDRDSMARNSPSGKWSEGNRETRFKMKMYTYGYLVHFSAFSEVVLPDGRIIRRVEENSGNIHYREIPSTFSNPDGYFSDLEENNVKVDDREIDGDELNTWLRNAGLPL